MAMITKIVSMNKYENHSYKHEKSHEYNVSIFLSVCYETDTFMGNYDAKLFFF